MLLTDGSTYVNLARCKKFHVGWRKEGKGKCVCIFFDDQPVFDLDTDDEWEAKFKFYDFISSVDLAANGVVVIGEIPLSSGSFLTSKDMWESERQEALY
jgi:hypothetical protein